MDGAGKGISRRGQPYAKGGRLPELSFRQAPAVRFTDGLTAAQGMVPGTRLNPNRSVRRAEFADSSTLLTARTR